jgi:hypothetical protein
MLKRVQETVVIGGMWFTFTYIMKGEEIIQSWMDLGLPENEGGNVEEEFFH